MSKLTEKRTWPAIAAGICMIPCAIMMAVTGLVIESMPLVIAVLIVFAILGYCQ